MSRRTNISSMSIVEDSMKIYVDNKPENCNNCIFKQIRSQHWDLEDNCFLMKKVISRINMDEDCPLEGLEIHNEIK